MASRGVGGGQFSADDDQKKAFWSKVGITDSSRDCWPWAGARKPKGYGNVRINRIYMLAHRVAFQLAVGPIPSGMQVCHVCDNPPCCNPSHLMLGTAASNAADMLIKNRLDPFKNKAIGARNVNSKLTETAVRDIRRRYTDGDANQIELAEQHGVTPSCIGSVVRNSTWRHVT